MNAWIGALAALATAALWAASSMIFSRAVARLGPMQVNVTRLLLGTFLLAATIAAARLPVSPTPRQLGLLLASGAAGIVFGDSCLFQAYHLAGARISQLVSALAPAMAAGLAFAFLHETLSPQAVVGAILTLGGVAVAVSERSREEARPASRRWLGMAFALLSALGQAGNLVLVKLAFREGPLGGMVASFIRLSSSLCLLLPAAAWAGSFKNPWRVLSRDRRSLMLVLAGSVVGPYLGITLSLVAVAHTEVGIAATLMATVPVLMLPMVRLVDREPLTWRAVGGAVVAVAGVAVLFLT